MGSTLVFDMNERRPEGVEGYSLDTGIFPTDAFSFTKPTATPPILSFTSGWKLGATTSISTIVDDDEFLIYDKNVAQYKRITFLSLAGAVATALGL